MPNQFTSLDDIVHSDAFGNYVNRDSIEKNPLFQAGLVNADRDFAAAIAKNGGTTHKTVLIPNFGDIDGDTQDLVDGTAITSEKLDTDWEELPAIGKAKAMAFYDSTVDLTVADPARRIADRVAPYWARQNKKFMLTALKGALAVDDFSDNVLDATDADIRALAPLLEAVLSDGAKCVVGNETQIRENAAAFSEVRPLSGEQE